MKSQIKVLPEHMFIVKQILQKHLPPDAMVWVFGSRANGTPKKFSDLDLAIDVGKPLSSNLISNLASDFDESDLPYKVDIVDWQTINENFKNIIAGQRVMLLTVSG